VSSVALFSTKIISIVGYDWRGTGGSAGRGMRLALTHGMITKASVGMGIGRGAMRSGSDAVSLTRGTLSPTRHGRIGPHTR
jgi:hypothetical protein